MSDSSPDALAARTAALERELAERKKAEAALRESEDRFKHVFESANVGKSITLPGGRIHVNRAFAEMLGYSREELSEKTWQELTPPEDVPETQAVVDSLLRGERDAARFTKRYLHKSGSHVWADVSVVVRRDAAGKPLHFITTVVDVTDRKRTEEALRENERRFRLIADNVRDTIWLMDLGFRTTWISPSVTRVRGFSLEELAEMPLERHLTPASMALVAELMATHVTPERLADPTAQIGASGEFEFYRKDGSTFWADSVISLLRDPDGAPSGFLGVGRDITDRKRAEAALQAERDKLHAFLTAAPAAIFVINEREEVVLANPAAERLFGRTVAGSSRRRCGDLIGCVHRGEDPSGCGSGTPCPSCLLYAAARDGLAGRAVRDRELELDLQLGDAATHRRLLCNAEPVVLEGRPGAILAVHDISDLRRAQQERERLQVSLAQADRLASMGMLAAGVAHEINNPLSYVLHNVESLAEDLPRLSEELRRCRAALLAQPESAAAAQALGGERSAFTPETTEDLVERLREAVAGAQRIKQIVRGLSTFARVEPTEAVPVQVQASLEHALTMAQNEMKYRARVVKDLAPVPPVLASDGKLAQVFLNLLINAAHAIDEGRVEENEIRVRTWSEGDRVCIEVSDTGRGIAPEHRARIFEPFFTTKGVGVGSGLGLSICRNLVTGFGGEIGFTSEAGRGTRFVVKLPRLADDWEKRDATPPDSPSLLPDVRGRILVVDDEPGIRRTIGRMLGRHHEVITASSGEEGRAILERDRRFDLIFCDLMMPTLSGMELHAWLSERDPELAGQVVFMTGGAFTPGASDYLAKVGNLRLEKPFDSVSFRKMAGELVLAARAKRRS